MPWLVEVSQQQPDVQRTNVYSREMIDEIEQMIG